MFFLFAEGRGLNVTFGSRGFSGLPTVEAVDCAWDFFSLKTCGCCVLLYLSHLVIRAQGQQGKCLTVHADLQFVHKRFSAVFSVLCQASPALMLVKEQAAL